MNRAVARTVFPLHELVKGKPTFRWLRELQESQWSRPEALAERRQERLRALVDHAYRHTPYYHRVMNARDITPADIQSLDDLPRLPYLTRHDIRRDFDALQSTSMSGRTQLLSTGGSTGVPVRVRVSMNQHGFAEAARLRAQQWFGVAPGDREVVFWGSPIELGRQSRWREIRDRILNTRLLSAFDLGEAGLAAHVTTLHAFRPQKIYGYASAIALVAKYLDSTGRRPAGGWPTAVFTTAEPLLAFQRRLIGDVFNCPVAVEYGARDAGLIAHECPAGRLHVNAEGIVVEIAEDPTFPEAGLGEIVVTNLLSYPMPLIRYRTGDVGRLDVSPCSCGRSLPALASVEGRRTDFIVTPEGRLLHALSVIYVLRDEPEIEAFQVVQEDLHSIRVTAVPGERFAPSQKARIVNALRQLTGPHVDIEIVLADHIERTASGKHRYVVSNVADSHVAGVFERVAR